MDFPGNILGTSLQEHSIYAIYVNIFWTEIHEKEFLDMKNAITSPACILLHPDWSSEFELHVDAHPKTQWEAKTCKICIKMFCKVCVNLEYITSRTFRCIIWVGNLKYLNSISPQQWKLACWCMALAEFDFYIVHGPGQEHVVPDFLSRNPTDKYPEFDNYVLPPAEVTNFFALALSFDIPCHEPSTVK